MTVRQNLEIQQGSTWEYTYTHTADLTGYTARARFATGYRDSGEVYLSTESDAQGGTITIDGTNVTLAMTASQTTAFAGDLSSYLITPVNRSDQPVLEFIYDLELESPSGVVTRPIQGKVFLSRGVT